MASRTEVKLARIENKTERVELRQETKKVAYENGIDPNAAMWGGLSSIAGSAAGYFSGNGNTGSTFAMSNKPGAGQQSTMLFVLAGVVLYFIFNKR
ncbi:MAG: hypothetical protein E6R08_02875 [Nevskiaceae bacterium]|nr:MAG: hypothetical protein E6R08_02875 [Nevskiaceae bacterium]